MLSEQMQNSKMERKNLFSSKPDVASIVLDSKGHINTFGTKLYICKLHRNSKEEHLLVMWKKRNIGSTLLYDRSIG